MLQQGDVILVSINKLPEDLKPHNNVLAEGEATGHHHTANGAGIAVMEGEKGELFLQAPLGATIEHEEHKVLDVPAGTYEVRRVQEYDHFEQEARRVVD